MSTTMKTAFKQAGIDSAADRLDDIAVQAIKAYGDKSSKTVEEIWGSALKDPSLMTALCGPIKEQAIGILLYRLRGQIAKADDKTKITIGTQKKSAKATREMTFGARDREILIKEAKNKALAEDRDNADQREAAWKATQIGRLTIGGEPIWNVSAKTARAWDNATGKMLRCVKLLIAGLPDDDRPIGYYRRPDEVDALWKKVCDA